MKGSNYIVYVDETDGKIKAKNATNGQVQFAGTNAAAIIQTVIDSL
jgi:hypothetical protein